MRPLMMSDGGGYWGHRTCDTDENDQLNARSVLDNVGKMGPSGVPRVTVEAISGPIGRGSGKKRSDV